MNDQSGELLLLVALLGAEAIGNPAFHYWLQEQSYTVNNSLYAVTSGKPTSSSTPAGPAPTNWKLAALWIGGAILLYALAGVMPTGTKLFTGLLILGVILKNSSQYVAFFNQISTLTKH